ncbi:MAG: Holliday junction resolvase RuvX [Chloroflexota bacterium]
MDSVCLGLDVGGRRVGVALSDPDGLVAVPLTTVVRRDTESAVEQVATLAREHNAGCIVVGLPALLSGEVGAEAERVQEFAKALERRTGRPVEWWDERLSSVAAEKLMRDMGARREKRDANRDALAAALILQAYLDHKRISSS